MAYQIPWQMLVPQGDAAHASMGTMDLGAIQRDRDWRQSQRNQLTTDVNDLNNKFANITAVNDEQAQLLAERKAYYDQQRQEILNGKGFITDKYNKIKLLGNQAANDPVLSNVKQWTEAYNANQLSINNLKNQDEDVAIALQKDLETRSKNPFITQINPEVDPTTGTYKQGAVGTNRYNQYLPTTLTEIPDLGLDAQKFLKDAGTQELISAGLRPLGKGQYLAINTNKILTEADALKQAADYIAQSNKYQDYFKLKEQGRQLRGLSWTEAEKRKYIEDAVRGSALHARTNDYDVENLDLTSKYTGPINPTNPTDPNQKVLVPGTPVGQEAVTVLQDSPKGFNGIEEYNQETQKRNNAYKNAKFKLQQYETGVVQATDAEIVKQKQLVKTLKQDYTLLASDKLAWERTQLAKKGTASPALQLKADLKTRGNLNSKGIFNPYQNAKIYTMPASKWRAKQQAMFGHDIPGNSASEVFDIAEKTIKGKATGWEKEIMNMHKQALEDFTGDKYSETEFALMMGGAGPTVGSKYAKLMQSPKFLKASTLLRRAGATGASTTDMEDIFKKMFYENITVPIQTGYDYHLKNGANFNPPTSTVQSMMQLPKIYKSVENAPAYEARVNFVGSFGDNLSKFHIVDNAGAALDEETAKTVKMQDVLAVGKAENGIMPVHFVGYTPETKKTKKRTGEYTLYVDINTNTAPKVQLQNFLKQANLSDPENNIVEGVLGSLNYTSNSNKIITDFKKLNPPTGTRKTFLPINGELESKKGWKQNVPELNNVPIVRTGETSYVIPDARQGSPYVAYYARLMKNKPEQTKTLINKVVKMTPDQQTAYFQENPQHMLVVTAATAYQTLKANNFKISFDSDEALQTYLDEVSRFYETVNTFD
jgi:hypothetical protein